ncbi:MAG TPA: hypothetical protein VF812_08455 [Ktedonobacterales bacterium]
MRAFQALLSRPESIARVRALRRTIEQAGGRVEIEPPSANGMVVVTLWLPPQYEPGEFFPDMPFYLV